MTYVAINGQCPVCKHDNTLKTVESQGAMNKQEAWVKRVNFPMGKCTAELYPCGLAETAYSAGWDDAMANNQTKVLIAAVEAAITLIECGAGEAACAALQKTLQKVRGE